MLAIFFPLTRAKVVPVCVSTVPSGLCHETVKVEVPSMGIQVISHLPVVWLYAKDGLNILFAARLGCIGEKTAPTIMHARINIVTVFFNKSFISSTP
jgi:hypothetical protein